MKRLTGVNTLLMTPFTESNEIDVARHIPADRPRP